MAVWFSMPEMPTHCCLQMLFSANETEQMEMMQGWSIEERDKIQFKWHLGARDLSWLLFFSFLHRQVV